jgi:hypothetical protein
MLNAELRIHRLYIGQCMSEVIRWCSFVSMDPIGNLEKTRDTVLGHLKKFFNLRDSSSLAIRSIFTKDS